MSNKPTIGRIVWYRTDGRNGLIYDLPAMITCTQETHPGDYPDGERNPLPVPQGPGYVHLTVFTPGGFGSEPLFEINGGEFVPASEVYRKEHLQDSMYKDAPGFTPGSGTYVEHNVPHVHIEGVGGEIPPRSWRWPTREE